MEGVRPGPLSSLSHPQMPELLAAGGAPACVGANYENYQWRSDVSG